MLVVTGTARSGTSMICNLLRGLGANFGDESLLMTADRWNPRGYFENREVNTLNHRLMFGNLSDPEHWVASVWPNTPVAFARNIATVFASPLLTLPMLIRRRAERLEGDMRCLAERYREVTVKDPRFSFTLPTWSSRGLVARVLYCYRHPHEVARSLGKKSHLPMPILYFGWHQWVDKFLRADVRCPVVYVDYNALFDPERRIAEMARLYAFADRPFDAEEAARVLASVSERELKHSDGAGVQLSGPVRRQYERLHELHDLHDAAALQPLANGQRRGS